MSQYYELGGVTLWNPSNGASRLFQRQVALFEEEVGQPSGIGPMEADEAHITPELFETFTAALLAWRGRTNHAVMTALSDGFIATLLVLAERAGVVVHWPASTATEVAAHDVQVGSTAVVPGDWASRLRGQARQLAGFMPR